MPFRGYYLHSLFYVWSIIWCSRQILLKSCMENIAVLNFICEEIDYWKMTINRKRSIEEHMKISLIVPCYNEQEALPFFYRETKKLSSPWNVIMR